jgi:DNA-binding transcriptional ArsR family regulator
MDSINREPPNEGSASSASIFDLFSLLSNPLRLHVLGLLVQAPLDGSSIVKALGKSKSRISQCLTKLTEAGLIEMHPEKKRHIFCACRHVTVSRASNQLLLQVVSSDGCTLCFTVHDGLFRRPLTLPAKQTSSPQPKPGREYEVKTRPDVLNPDGRPKARRIVKPWLPHER